MNSAKPGSRNGPLSRELPGTTGRSDRTNAQGCPVVTLDEIYAPQRPLRFEKRGQL